MGRNQCYYRTNQNALELKRDEKTQTQQGAQSPE